jgi:hypothetical protein
MNYGHKPPNEMPRRPFSNGMPQRGDGELALELVKYRVVSMPYSRMRNILAETGQSDTLLLRALRAGHGIVFDSLRKPDTEIFFVIDSQADRLLKENGVANATWLQVIGTSRGFGLTAAGAVKRFRRAVGADDGPPGDG